MCKKTIDTNVFLCDTWIVGWPYGAKEERTEMNTATTIDHAEYGRLTATQEPYLDGTTECPIVRCHMTDSAGVEYQAQWPLIEAADVDEDLSFITDWTRPQVTAVTAL